MISTPYDKEVAESNVGFAHPAWFARQGYMVVAHDTRGRYKSEGTFNPFFDERNDLASVIEWAAQLDGCDGRVATYGFSYPGLNQLLAAQDQPAPLQAIAPSFTGGSPYREWFYSQGALELAFTASWANFLALDAAAQRGDDGALAQLGAALADAQKWYWALPIDAYPPLGDGQAPFFFDWVGHPTFDEFWKAIEVDHALIEQPGLHVGGWYDVFVRGTVRNFTELSSAGHAPQKLVLGPWHHMPWKPLGGESAEAGPTLVDDWHVRFWNETLKGQPTGVFDAPVSAYLMGGGWHEADAWPPSATTPAEWFFHSGGRATSSFGDGTLTTSSPDGEPPDVYTYVASNPSMSMGGRSCCIEHLAPMGPADQRGREETRIALVYTSAPLESELLLLGDVRMTLYASSSAADTDFSARLCRVDDGGTSVNLTEGIVRARFRDSLSAPTPIEPGVVYEYSIDLGPVGARLGPGERIRVSVSSSDFPLYDRNLNTGGPLYGEPASAEVLATQSVLHDAEHPSRITLPRVSTLGSAPAAEHEATDRDAETECPKREGGDRHGLTDVRQSLPPAKSIALLVGQMLAASLLARRRARV